MSTHVVVLSTKEDVAKLPDFFTVHLCVYFLSMAVARCSFFNTQTVLFLTEKTNDLDLGVRVGSI